MKTLRKIALLTVMASTLFTTVAQAAPTIGVYFGEEKWPWLTAAPNQPFDIWVIVRNVEGTINAVDYKLNLPDKVIITDMGFGDSYLHLGSPSTGFAVGLGSCMVSLGDDEIVVQRIRAYVFSTFPQTAVTLTAFEGSQQESPTAPRYSNCAGGIFDMDTEDGILVGTTVDNEAASFGAVKALY
jgi:hypothetical protein